MHALLHGHSYTAHPVGCSAGLEALSLYTNPSFNPNLCLPASPAAASTAGGGQQQQQEGRGGCRKGCTEPCGQLLPVWDEARAQQLSKHPRIQGVVVLGEQTLYCVSLFVQGTAYSTSCSKQGPECS